MNDKARREELRTQFEQNRPEAGVYRIVNTRTNRALLGSAANLASVRNKLTFAQSTKTAAVLDRRLGDDIREFGLDAFAFDVLEVLETKPEMTPAAIQEELATMEALWREMLDPAELY